MINLQKKTVIYYSLMIILSCMFFVVQCSMQKLAVRATEGILTNEMTALYEESDLILAEQAIAANLKLLEGLIKSDPGNDKLLLMAAEGYTSYALGFVEDQSPERASTFYMRGRNYALKVLKKNNQFRAAIDQNMDQFQQALETFNEKDVPALFWMANAWASYINLNKTDVSALAELPEIQAIMERVLELDETFYYGGTHLFLGIIYSSRPPMLGGNLKKAKKHFETCLSINQSKFLMAKYFYARTYAVQAQDRDLFGELLQEIVQAPDDVLPEQRLSNEIAKQKAHRLIKKEDELFL